MKLVDILNNSIKGKDDDLAEIIILHGTSDDIDEILDLDIEEVVDEKGMPELGEMYWYAGDDGLVHYETWDGFASDKYRYYSDNCFKTKEEAKQRVEYLINLACK